MPMASLMSTLAMTALSGVKLSMPVTGQQMLIATLVAPPLDQWPQHQHLQQQHQVKQQRHQGQEVSPVDPTLQTAALEHCVEDPHQSL